MLNQANSTSQVTLVKPYSSQCEAYLDFSGTPYGGMVAIIFNRVLNQKEVELLEAAGFRYNQKTLEFKRILNKFGNVAVSPESSPTDGWEFIADDFEAIKTRTMLLLSYFEIGFADETTDALKALNRFKNHYVFN